VRHVDFGALLPGSNPTEGKFCFHKICDIYYFLFSFFVIFFVFLLGHLVMVSDHPN